MSLREMKRLFDHVRWADERVLEALRTSGGEPPRALEIFAHVLGSEHVWLRRMMAETPEVAIWPDPGLESSGALLEQNHAAYRAYLSGLTHADLESEVAYRNSAGVAFESRIRDILLHVSQHGMYHRGQVALLMRDAGHEPAPTDYIAFVRGAPAARSHRG